MLHVVDERTNLTRPCGGLRGPLFLRRVCSQVDHLCTALGLCSCGFCGHESRNWTAWTGSRYRRIRSCTMRWRRRRLDRRCRVRAVVLDPGLVRGRSHLEPSFRRPAQAFLRCTKLRHLLSMRISIPLHHGYGDGYLVRIVHFGPRSEAESPCLLFNLLLHGMVSRSAALSDLFPALSRVCNHLAHVGAARRCCAAKPLARIGGGRRLSFLSCGTGLPSDLAERSRLASNLPAMAQEAFSCITLTL